MRSGRNFVWRITGLSMCALLFLFGYSAPMRTLRMLPETVYGSSQASAMLGSLTGGFLSPHNDEAVGLSSDERLYDAAETDVTFRIAGIPLKTVHISPEDTRLVAPGGTLAGIAIRTEGVLVVGLGVVETEGGAVSPGSAAGLKAGDVILRADGKSVNTSEQLSRVTENGEGHTLTVERNGERLELTVRTAEDASDGVNRLGIWVRDSTAGIGTVSFVDRGSEWFAALGHPVSDIDTQALLPIGDGIIVPATLADVKRGTEGSPGELVGTFSVAGTRLGRIRRNTEIGLFGETETAYSNGISDDMGVADANAVHVGKAQIIATVTTDGTKLYDCEVMRVFSQSAASGKGMIVKITDEALLKATGGIVQGMSGCPILQDGKLVGAVTHVFVGDPTRGYGVYAEWMLDRIVAEAAG